MAEIPSGRKGPEHLARCTGQRGREREIKQTEDEKRRKSEKTRASSMTRSPRKGKEDRAKTREKNFMQMVTP